MPELPEVETVAIGLSRQMAGMQVRDCILNRPNMRFAFPDDLQEKVIGARIESITRRAKYLRFALDNGESLLAHLGMSGTMRVVEAADYAPRKHDHLLFELEDGRLFVFHDPRRFGFMLLESQSEAQKMLNNLGPEPLSADFSPEYLEKALLKRQMPIKTAIMGQRLVVGVGNIYASEALFRAELSPEMKACDAAPYAGKLHSAIIAVLGEAIASGGSTLRDYVRSDGDLGYFQHHFAVYGRSGEPCLRCKSPIEALRQAGRSTFFCPQCQPFSSRKT